MENIMSKRHELEKLANYQKRKFVPDNVDLGKVPAIKDLFNKLIALDIKSKKDFEKWVLDLSEFEAALDQRETILYINMTCQTDDEKRAEEYSDFIKHIKPLIRQYKNKLDAKHINLLQKYKIDKKYALYNRGVKADADVFAKENITLETELNILSQEYQKVIGQMSVEFEGKNYTVPQMNKFLFETDRDLRERAWRAMAKRRLQDKEQLDKIFNRMVSLRTRIAKNVNCRNYTEYVFKAMHRFDYTPLDCKKYHSAVEKVVVPVLSRLLKLRAKKMGLEKLKPWDIAVDPEGKEPLKPFTETGDFINGVHKIFSKMDQRLSSSFEVLMKESLLDLESRSGKAPGGYMSTLNEARKPFIFMNAVGIDDDVRTLLHESGHAFHALQTKENPLFYYRHAPLEFSEVASMSMELLGSNYLSPFYNEDDAKRSNYYLFEEIISLLVWVAVIDCFQHWIYENPKHTAKERFNSWLKIRKRFKVAEIDWGGLEEEEGFMWHKQLHIFEAPFYYIEYAIAQLGALQLWSNSEKNFSRAIDNYLKALKLGGSKPLKKLFHSAGIKFSFSSRIISSSVDTILKQLDNYRS